MISIARVKEATSEFIKVLRFGKNDLQTSENVLPFGIDSKPIKELQAVHATTGNDETTLILGYLLKSELTSEGEMRIYSKDATGDEKFYFYLKNDGTAELGGNIDNLIRHAALNTDLQTFITDLNAKLVTAFTALGGSWPGTSLNIASSKIEEIKTL